MPELIFPPMLARTTKSPFVPDGWMMQPKVDGYRILCRKGVAWSRGLKTQPWTSLMERIWPSDLRPNHAVDGELWHVDGFEAMGCTRRKECPEEEIKKLRFFIFDCVTDEPFITRQMRLPEPNVEGAPVEGYIYRDPNGIYEPGKRSKGLLKYKPVITHDGFVEEIIPGEGKHKGRLGALVLDNGLHIGTGFSDSEREEIWNVGDMVEYSVQERFYSEKRHPVFIRRRPNKDI